MSNLLEIRNLSIQYQVERGEINAVNNISFNVKRGETLGLVGESACGKSTVGLSIMRLLPDNGRIVSGSIIFDGIDLTTLNMDELKNIRLKKISMIPQASLDAMNPVFKVGDIIVEALRAHEEISKDKAKERVAYLFELVGIPLSRLNSYPHQLSGGMKQRAMIALSLVCNPDLIIADEPTTALDVVVQDIIIHKINELRSKLGVAMIMISHDISVIAETCEKMAIMYGGRLFEYGNTKTIFNNSYNPYTQALLKSFPSLIGPKKQLMAIPGSPPLLLGIQEGCVFEPRCQHSKIICKNMTPPWTKIDNGHYSLCHDAQDMGITNYR